MTYSCPPWWQDDSEHTSRRALVQMRACLAEARLDARSHAPKIGDTARWHARVFKDDVPLDYYAGAYRQEDPKRVCLGRNVGVGGRVGVDYRHVPRAVRELQSALQTGLYEIDLRWDGLAPTDRVRSIAALIGTAVGAFIKIHPFLNGNGRMSRMLWSVLLARFGLSHHFSILGRPPGPSYAEAMKEAMGGDYSLCILLVLEGLAKQRVPSLPV